jgi:hypothetical protein
MTDIERLKTQFVESAIRNGLTIQGIIAAIHELDASWGDIASYIMDYCHERNIESAELDFIEQETANGKAKIARERKKQALKSLKEQTEHILNSLTDERISMNDPKLIEAEAELTYRATNLKSVSGEYDDVEDCRATPEKNKAEWNNDNDQDFSPSLFDGLAFPNGTVSYIGARTGRGKTTTMVNLAIEAMNAKRKTSFISLEESNKQLIRRFALCLAYDKANTQERSDLLNVTNPFTGKTDPKNAYKNLMRGREIGGNGAKTFVTLVNKAQTEVDTAITDRLLNIYDMRGKNLSTILRIVWETNKDNIVLLDYIQKIPSTNPLSRGGNADLERIRDGSQELINAAKMVQCVIIAGAQLNRESQSGNAKGDDTFTDADFRGCGDIEQDAHNAIGIGRNKEKTKTYYGLIKARESEIIDENRIIDFKGGYSYMKRLEETFKPNSSKNGNRSDESKTPSKRAGALTDDEIRLQLGMIKK